MKIKIRNSDIVFEVDDNFDVSNYTSFVLTPRGYVRGNGNGDSRLLHRHITGAKKGEVVDHIDNNKLNNKSSNLRVCSQAQNLWNQGARNPNSGYKGVYKCGKGWQARIRMFRKLINIGYYTDKEEAARAYNEAAKEGRGEFAILNSMNNGEVKQ